MNLNTYLNNTTIIGNTARARASLTKDSLLFLFNLYGRATFSCSNDQTEHQHDCFHFYWPFDIEHLLPANWSRVLQIGIVYFYCSSSSRWLKKNYPKHVIYIDGDSIYRDVRCYFILCILFSCGKLYSGWQYFLINVLCNA